MCIPRIIHQTFRHTELSPALQGCIKRLRSSNPGWEYRFYDDQACLDFVRTHYDRRILAAYNSINPRYGAAKADVFRYLLMYRVGGVYLDVKSGASRSLDEIVAHHPYILSHWDNSPYGTHPGWGLHFSDLPRGEYQQWHICAQPEHPYLKAVIARVLENLETYKPRHTV